MNTEAKAGRAPNAAFIMLITGLLAGVLGGVLVAAYLPGLNTRQAVPDANLSGEPPGSSPVQTENTGPSIQSAGPGVETPPDGTAQPDNSASDPLATEALRAILERRAAEEKRLDERARLAFESPLTPSVAEISEQIASRQDAEPPNSAVAGNQPAPQSAVSDGRAAAAGSPTGPLVSPSTSPTQGHILTLTSDLFVDLTGFLVCFQVWLLRGAL